MGPVISGGIRTDASLGDSTSVTLTAVDLDLDETLRFSLGTKFDHSDPSLDPVTSPFVINAENEIEVTFDPQSTMKGFFNFSVFVHDSGTYFTF
jgi:hypothetical protein